MRLFEDEDGFSWPDVLIRLVHQAQVTHHDTQRFTNGHHERPVIRLSRALPDGSTCRAVFAPPADPAEVLTPWVIRGLCRRLGLSVDEIDLLFGWALPDYPSDHSS